MDFKPLVSIKPKVIIVILNWNGLNDIIECLESLKKITYPNYEIIVVDNGSSNNEAEEIEKKYPEIVAVKNPANEGVCRGNNVGAKMALKNGADYLLFLNNDTTVRADFLEKLVDFCQRNSDVGAAGPLILNYYQRDKVYSCGGKLNKFLFSIKEYKFAHKIPQKDLNFVSGCAFLIKKSLIEKIGLWDEDFFVYWDDTDYCFRIKKAGFKIACVPQSIIYHKVAKANKYLSKRYIYYMTRNNLLIAKKHARWYCWPLLLVNFFARKWIGYFLKLILTNNLSSFLAIISGTRDFVLGRYGKRENLK